MIGKIEKLISAEVDVNKDINDTIPSPKKEKS